MVPIVQENIIEAPFEKELGGMFLVRGAELVLAVVVRA